MKLQLSSSGGHSSPCLSCCVGSCGGVGSSWNAACSRCPACTPAEFCNLFSFALPCVRGQTGCGQDASWPGLAGRRDQPGGSCACTDQPCPHRVQPLRVQDPRPAGADDEQQHELRLRLAADKREEIALCPVRLRSPACSHSCSRRVGGMGTSPQCGVQGGWLQFSLGCAFL